MTRLNIALVASIILCLPLHTIAQDPPRSVSLDSECQKQVKDASPYCQKEMDRAMRACFQHRLTPKCAEQANAPSNVPRDDTCKAEFMAVSSPCAMEGQDAVFQCALSKTSDKCKSQITGTWQRQQQQCQEDTSRAIKEMDEAMQQMRRCLKLATTQEQNACAASIKKPKRVEATTCGK